MSKLKSHNHFVHPVDRVKKMDLLKHVIESNSSKSILVISALDITTLDLPYENVTLKSDDMLKDEKYDIVISIDISTSVSKYLKRVKHAKDSAILIADEKDQLLIYQIETKLHKAIKREIIKEFEPQLLIDKRYEKEEKARRKAFNIKMQDERDAQKDKAKKPKTRKSGKSIKIAKKHIEEKVEIPKIDKIVEDNYNDKKNIDEIYSEMSKPKRKK